jgi:hypothetical protein
MVFDTGMQPEAAELVREQVVDTIAERIIDRWTAAATSKRDDQ